VKFIFMFFFRLCSVGPIVSGLVCRAGLPGKLQFVLDGKFIIVYIREGFLLGGDCSMIPQRAGTFHSPSAKGRDAYKYLPHPANSAGRTCCNGLSAR